MTSMETTVFSEYEARELNIIFPDNSYVTVECLGTIEEEATVRKVEKKCRGVVRKSRTRGTGSGTIKISAHMPYQGYLKLHAMDSDDKLIDGVHAYGNKSLHPNVVVTSDLYDEDDNRKFKAWPKCTATTGPVRKTENGAEEVAEVEIEFAYSPDDYGNGVYECLYADLEDDTAKTSWLTGFKPEMVHDGYESGSSVVSGEPGASGGASEPNVLEA